MMCHGSNLIPESLTLTWDVFKLAQLLNMMEVLHHRLTLTWDVFKSELEKLGVQDIMFNFNMRCI